MIALSKDKQTMIFTGKIVSYQKELEDRVIVRLTDVSNPSALTLILDKSLDIQSTLGTTWMISFTAAESGFGITKLEFEEALNNSMIAATYECGKQACLLSFYTQDEELRNFVDPMKEFDLQVNSL